MNQKPSLPRLIIKNKYPLFSKLFPIKMHSSEALLFKLNNGDYQIISKGEINLIYTDHIELIIKGDIARTILKYHADPIPYRETKIIRRKTKETWNDDYIFTDMGHFSYDDYDKLSKSTESQCFWIYNSLFITEDMKNNLEKDSIFKKYNISFLKGMGSPPIGIDN